MISRKIKQPLVVRFVPKVVEERDVCERFGSNSTQKGICNAGGGIVDRDDCAKGAMYACRFYAEDQRRRGYEIKGRRLVQIK